MKNDYSWLRPFLVGAFLPAIILALTLAWLAWGTWAPEIASWSTGSSSKDFSVGVWGDSYGAYNALVGSLGFGAVAFTLLLQMRALKQQQDDLHRQRFESTFFELLKLLRECREQVEVRHIMSGTSQRGIPAFDLAIREIESYKSGVYGERKRHEDNLATIYEKEIHRNFETTISPYFRVIYRILERLRSDKILNWDEKLSYAKLLRGQLSSSELAIMGLNGRLALAKDFAQLVTQFRLLKYLPDNEYRLELKKHYPREAFMGHDD